jgi:hypothetical protein
MNSGNLACFLARASNLADVLGHSLDRASDYVSALALSPDSALDHALHLIGAFAPARGVTLDLDVAHNLARSCDIASTFARGLDRGLIRDSPTTLLTTSPAPASLPAAWLSTLPACSQ